MNLKLNAKQEYMMLLDYYANPDSDSNLPAELKKIEEIYNFCYPFLLKGYLSQKQIAKLLLSSEIGKKNELKLQVCLHHVSNARLYFLETHEETAEVHRLRLTKLLYKQIEALSSISEFNPTKNTQIIKELAIEIAKLNRCYSDDNEKDDPPVEVSFILSDNHKEIPALAESDVTDSMLFSMVDKLCEKYNISDLEANRIKQKDINGSI